MWYGLIHNGVLIAAGFFDTEPFIWDFKQINSFGGGDYKIAKICVSILETLPQRP